MKVYQSSSSRETKKFASELARKIAKRTARKNAKGSLVFALQGELGSGKTTFIQGFLRGLGIKKRSASPTFIIFRRFKFRNSDLGFRNLFHIDAYRIKKPRELLALGLKEIFADPKNIVLIEWADNVGKIIPKSAKRAWFFNGKKENERQIKLHG